MVYRAGLHPWLLREVCDAKGRVAPFACRRVVTTAVCSSCAGMPGASKSPARRDSRCRMTTVETDRAAPVGPCATGRAAGDRLIERMPYPRDGRSSSIVLTQKARDRFPAARAILVEDNSKAVEGLTEEEVTTLTRLLEKVLANLE